MKAGIVVVVIVALVSTVLFIQGRITGQVKAVKTLDSMGQIYVALSRSLGNEPLEKYNAVAETLKLFPSLSVTSNQIADAWGRPIKISITKVGKGFNINLESPGADGRIDTKDDIRQDYLLLKDTNLSWTEGKGVSH
jgi:hypothetical protein